MRRSVEVEYWVIDERGRLTAPESLLDVCQGVEKEFTVPLIEIKTPPCASHEKLRCELYDRLDAVVTHAETVGKGLVPLATPLTEVPIEDRPSERTRIQDRVLGDDFEYIRQCSGTHIHMEQQPGSEIDQYNTIVSLDPALALVNSAPYASGERIATGARSKLYRWLAYRNLPQQGELWPYISGREEYAHRIQRRYEEFVTEAIVAGFDREVVESAFEAEGAVWTPVQFRQEFSTVEWRSPDTTLPSQVLRLADDLVSTVEGAVETDVRIDGDRGEITPTGVVLPRFDRIQEYVETAIHDGLTGSVEAYLDRMGFDVDAYTPVARELPTKQQLTIDQARDIRLEYADRLKEDIKSADPVAAD